MKTFVEFYDSLKISPVSQDISDLRKHFRRRSSLYRTVGIPPGFLRGRSVIEFGPGSGHNGLHTAALQPDRYVLVDGNSSGLKALRELFEAHSVANTEVVHSLFEDFQSDETFDLVICEGTLPFQPDPEGLLKHLASFVAPGGVLLITCIDSVSYLAEALRRFYARIGVAHVDDPGVSMDELLQLLSPHLATLEGMTRPHNEWILDNVVQPFAGRKLIGFEAASEALSDDFSLYNCSPNIFHDSRWYKQVTGEPGDEFNEMFLGQYKEQVHGFLDYRSPFEAQSEEANTKLLEKADVIYDLCLAAEESGVDQNAMVGEMLVLVQGIEEIISKYAESQTIDSLIDYQNGLKHLLEGKAAVDYDFTSFKGFFGRGQQYLSFLRNFE